MRSRPLYPPTITWVLGLSLILSCPLFSFRVLAQENRCDSAFPLEVPVLSSFGLSSSGHISSAFSNQQVLKRENYLNNEIQFLLSDGTRVGGLFFPKFGIKKQKLLIGTFGFMTDRWAAPDTQFVLKLLKENLIDAHVLILDHPTSAPFAVYNHSLSPGGYDEGRMLIEITEQIKSQKLITDLESVHLIGISMGGNGVVHALAEDARLNKKLFKSAITFSTAVDLSEVPGRQLVAFESEAEKSDGKNKVNFWNKVYRVRATDFISRTTVRVLFDHFRGIYKMLQDDELLVENNDIGSYFYLEFKKRIDFLDIISKNPQTQWNPSVSTNSVFDFMASSDLKNVIQQIQTPLIMIHSEDDPAVLIENVRQLNAFVKTQNLKCVNTFELPHGGHWGYSMAYGTQWLGKTIQQVLDF